MEHRESCEAPFNPEPHGACVVCGYQFDSDVEALAGPRGAVCIVCHDRSALERGAWARTLWLVAIPIGLLMACTVIWNFS